MDAALPRARSVSLATYRKSGREVATPVWCAHGDGIFYVFSARDAGKVKRLRNSSRARIAVCGPRGALQGAWHDASAAIVDDPAEIARALALLRRKYGLAMWLADAGAKLTGRFRRRAYIRITLNSDPQAGGADSVRRGAAATRCTPARNDTNVTLGDPT